MQFSCDGYNAALSFVKPSMSQSAYRSIAGSHHRPFLKASENAQVKWTDDQDEMLQMIWAMVAVGQLKNWKFLYNGKFELEFMNGSSYEVGSTTPLSHVMNSKANKYVRNAKRRR